MVNCYADILTPKPAGYLAEGWIPHVIDVNHARQRERHRVRVDVIQDVPMPLSNFPPPCTEIDRGRMYYIIGKRRMLLRGRR